MSKFPSLRDDPTISTAFIQDLQDTIKVSDTHAMIRLDAIHKATSIHARVVAQMLRHHAQLFLRHAAILERMALRPNRPATWDLNHEDALPLEELQEKIKEEAIIYLAKNSYQTMKCMRKRWKRLKHLVRLNLVDVAKRKISTTDSSSQVP